MGIKVSEAIKLLEALPQDVELLIAQNGGGFESIYSIHTQEVISPFDKKPEKKTVVVADMN